MAIISHIKVNNAENPIASNNMLYGVCSTAAATAAKTVTISDSKFTLQTGATIVVKFTITNTAANPTLNVDSTGAKAIYYNGAAITAGYLKANKVYEFIYNGTQWDLIGDVDTNTTYTSLKNPNALTIQGNGTTLTNGTYDGSAAKTVNITASAIGAAASSHNHAASNITSGTLNSARLPTIPITKGGTGATTAAAALTNLGAAPAYTYGTEDLVPGETPLETGKLHFVYE